MWHTGDMDRPLFYIGFGYYLTLVLLALTGTGFAIALLTAALAGAGVFYYFDRRHPGEHRNWVFIAVLLVSAMACIQFMVRTAADYKPKIAMAGQTASVSGKVIETCRDSQSGAHRCIVKTNAPKAMKIRVSSKKYLPRQGDEISFRGKFYKMDDSWKSKRVYLGAYPFDSVHVDKKGRGSLREKITRRINAQMSDPYSALLTGMLTGDKDDLSDDMQETLRSAGVSHLFAVSGFHCSLWTMMLWRLLTRVRVPRTPACLTCLAFLLFFTALTGFSKSCLRAAVMLTIFFLGRMFLQRPDSLNSLGLAVFLISVWNPFSGGDAAILLSTLSTLGIFLLSKPIISWLNLYLLHRIPHYKVRKAAEKAAKTLTFSASTFVFTLPALVILFGSVSLISPFTNLLVSPAASMAILLTGLGVLNIPLLKSWLFLGAGLAAKYILAVCKVFANFRFSTVRLDAPWFQFALSLVLILISFHCLLGCRRTQAAVLSGIILLTSIFSYQLMNQNVLLIDFPAEHCATICYDGSAAAIEQGGDYKAASDISQSISQNGGRKVIALIGSDRLAGDLEPEQTITRPGTVELFPEVSVSMDEDTIKIKAQGHTMSMEGKTGLRIYMKHGKVRIVRNDIAKS